MPNSNNYLEFHTGQDFQNNYLQAWFIFKKLSAPQSGKRYHYEYAVSRKMLD